MKIVQLCTDNRDLFGEHNKEVPLFGAAPVALLQGFSQIANVEVHVVSCVRKKVSSPHFVFNNIHYHSVIVPKSGWMSTLYSGCIKATKCLLREIQPDIVHGQGTERDCAMTSSHSAFTNVITIHGNMAELYRLGMTFKSARLYGFLAANLENHALSRTSGVFCNSAYTESLVAPRAKQTWRVPNAIRAEFFRPSSIASRPNDVPILLNVGHLGMRKRQLEILRLAAELHNEGYRFKLIFTGDTQYTDEYNRAFATELENAVKAGYAAHTGFLDSDKLIQLMDQADGFVHFPSEEAFGLVVAEALARGLKFFGANLGGIKEIGNEVPGAELFDNMNDLKDGISSWLAAGAYRMPGAADRMKKLYSPHAVARRHVEIYASLLGANDSPLLAHSTSEMNLET